MQLVDSHCHLNFPELLSRLPEVLDNAQQNNIGHILCISTSWENFATVLEMAEDHPHLFASVGVHPTTTEGYEPTTSELIERGRHDKVIAVGETGLDYHWIKEDREWQHLRFHRHIEAAKELKKPLVIHTRSAATDTMQTLRDHNARDAGGVMHCFAEDWNIAQQALDIGFYISFSGIVTFKNAPLIQEVARKTPLDKILVETDAPYLAPVPHRGKTNEPAFVKHTAQFVAELREISMEELTEATTNNFFNLFATASPAGPS